MHDRGVEKVLVRHWPLSPIRDNFRPRFVSVQSRPRGRGYLPSSYREETVNFAVSIGDKQASRGVAVRCWRTATPPHTAVGASDRPGSTMNPVCPTARYCSLLLRSGLGAGWPMRRFRRRFARSLETDLALRFLDDVLAGALPFPAKRFLRQGGSKRGVGRRRRVER